VISFRYHIVSLVAVLLSLAAGVVLGGGPLSDLGRSDSTASPSSADTKDAARAEAFADSFAEQGAARLYADGLAKRGVVLISFPGASDTTRNALAKQVAAAGGKVTGSYAVQANLVDPGEKTLVDTLGSQLMTQLPDGTVSSDAATYDRLGELLGTAVASTEATGSAELGDRSTTILSSLDGAGLVTSTGKATGRASYAVLLLGDDSGTDADPIYAGLVTGLASHAAGVVVVSGGDTGTLERLREDPAAEQVATVDGADGAAGQVTTVLTLTQWPASKGGSFGAAGTDGAVGLR